MGLHVNTCKYVTQYKANYAEKILCQKGSTTMKQTVKKAWNGLTTILVAMVLLLVAMLWGVRLFGLDLFIVQSGSMEPEYPTGSIVYVKEVDANTLTVGDVITFQLSDGVCGTHRIIDIVEENGTFQFKTKGDANDVEDSGYVSSEDIVGKAVFCIPQLGFFTAFIQTKQGMYVGIAAVALLLLLLIIPDLLFAESKKDTEQGGV